MDKLIVVLLMILDCSIAAFGAIFFKKASKSFEKFNIKKGNKIKSSLNIIKNKKLLFGLFLYILSATLLTFLLIKENLSFIYPLTSITYIIIIFLSNKILNEKITKYKWIAIFLIILGNIFITL